VVARYYLDQNGLQINSLDQKNNRVLELFDINHILRLNYKQSKKLFQLSTVFTTW